MRLIDADSYATQMKKRQDACLRWKEDAVLDGDDETRLRADGALSTFIEAKLTLDKMPTIEAVPFVHRHWTFAREMMYCSECAAAWDRIYTIDYNYCPNCGAKMDDEVSEEGKNERND